MTGDGTSILASFFSMFLTFITCTLHTLTQTHVCVKIKYFISVNYLSILLYQGTTTDYNVMDSWKAREIQIWEVGDKKWSDRSGCEMVNRSRAQVWNVAALVQQAVDDFQFQRRQCREQRQVLQAVQARRHLGRLEETENHDCSRVVRGCCRLIIRYRVLLCIKKLSTGSVI